MRIGNAPVSWGIYEAAMSVGNEYPFEKLLGEIAEAGYEGTGLGLMATSPPTRSSSTQRSAASG